MHVLPAIISAALHENRLHQTQVMRQAAHMFINEPPPIPPRTMQRFWRLVQPHPMRVLKEFSDGKNCVQWWRESCVPGMTRCALQWHWRCEWQWRCTDRVGVARTVWLLITLRCAVNAQERTLLTFYAFFTHKRTGCMSQTCKIFKMCCFHVLNPD